MIKKPLLPYAVVVASLIALALPLPAHAGSLSINLNATYWVMAENDADTGAQECCATLTNMVLPTLGPNGLPLVNPIYTASGHIKDVNSEGEITWWSPTFNPDVSFLSTGSATIPFASLEYPPDGNDFNGFLTAEFQGTFSLPSSSKVEFTTDSDDDSLLYIDGQLVVDNGGVKNRDSVLGTDFVGAGQHSLTLFYADRDPQNAYLQVSDSVTETPEPATLTLMGIGLLGFAGARRRWSRNAQ